YSTTGAPNMQLSTAFGNSTTLGSDVHYDTNLIGTDTNASNDEWATDFYLTCNAAPGASASVTGEGEATVFFQGDSNNADMSYVSHTLATNASFNIYVFLKWDAASSSNTATLEQLIVQSL